MYRRDAIRELMRGFSDDSVGAVSGCKIVVPRVIGPFASTLAPSENDVLEPSGRPSHPISHAAARPGASDAGFGRSEGLYWRYENLIRSAESRLGSTVATVGEIFAVRRNAFRPMPAWVVNDDAHLTLDLLRRGWDVRYAPAAQAEELASLSTTDERLRRRRISAGRWLLLSDFRLWPVNRPFVLLALLSHKALRLAMPFAMAAALTGNLVLAAGGTGGLAIRGMLAAQLAFYAVSLAGRKEGTGGGALRRLSRLCHFMVASNVSLALGFVDWVGSRQVVLWEKAAR